MTSVVQMNIMKEIDAIWRMTARCDGGDAIGVRKSTSYTPRSPVKLSDHRGG